ncbi:WD40/YVTN/BNR-like repeat-containing protein [Candidatus Palauibacter sp.]|uniref:WD40/YVTN/BNR-like repeat-containing protein n=1 Tax=Candidatus Palauibacter sp. TaxID=3101350 RepID=UPI003B02589C
MLVRSVLVAMSLAVLSPGLAAQDPVSLLPPMEWRSIGPDRGGRSIAVAGHADRPFEYYFGATGGGLFKTTDGGTTWTPVTDGEVGSASVGAVAMAPSDPDIVYIGMGEVQLRANVLQGDGVYRSDDAGKNWRHLGLAETHAIGRIRIHPTDPDRAYVAALGHPFGPNPERGVFRTTDGGETWERVLFRDERTGAVDLVMDPSDPDVLYATLWQVYRKPWRLWSGGEGSGIFKSTDGGDTWTEITRNPGLPDGVLGKITMTVSGADPNRVWANLEAERGGLYRSDDAGRTWEFVNGHRDIWQRAFYFQRLAADPVDRNTLYILNFRLMRSTDGGLTLESVPESHVDHHDLWIDPTNPLRMINGNDGGGVVTVNGGRTWTSMRVPTAQIYRLATTADFPYHVCGAQQDNSTVCVSSEPAHLRDPRGVSTEWMYPVGGGESGYIAPHPADPDIFYAGATNTLTRYDRTTGMATDIQPWPRIVMGEPARDMPERWNWTYPIAVAPAPPHALYVGSQHLWRSLDEGRSWEKISPDLTRAEPETLGDSGGPIIKDQDGPEIYGTLYSIGLSPHEPETIWTGSDDGLVHVSRDGGGNWQDVTPPDMPPHTRVMTIDVSPHRPASAHVAGIRYEMDDRAPYAWRTDDYGARWTRIDDGIPDGAFVRVIREDPERAGLMYAGTERGVFVSFDAGSSWSDLSFELPDTPVTGLSVEARDLVISTHGRSFWVLDDIETLRQLDADLAGADVHLFRPADAVRRSVPAVIDFRVSAPERHVRLDILTDEREHVRTLVDEIVEGGTHRVRWDLRYRGAVTFPGIVLEGGDPSVGPWAPPGRYLAGLTVGDVTREASFDVRLDPRLGDLPAVALTDQFRLAMAIRDAESRANESVILVRDLLSQIDAIVSRADDAGLRDEVSGFAAGIESVAGELYQLRNQSPKDKIAFPIKLNDRLTGLRSHLERGDGTPIDAYQAVFNELSAELEVHLQALDDLLSDDLPRLNRRLTGAGLPRIEVDPAE